ncbi:restriction endonuclease subunit S [Pectinatus frisingensis]|uniref:restriction endonuclease subunit S n=1 Tax=Pectinatus frisingensis TaxID=865 RepID=UPI0015F5EADA|nr:restriction endonuclease subunit S [Pectinatus frisingensis]
MIADKLRKSVLQAAIQGKLTEQLSSDGNACNLLTEIQIEKKRLIKDGKIKKEKPLPEITEDEIPFDIPDNWCWVRFGELVNIRSAQRVHQKDWRNKGIPFYRAREISKLADFGCVDNELYINIDLYNEFKRATGVPQKGDLMVTGVGTLGKTYIVKNTDQFYYKDASVLCFENFAKLNSKYIKYLMESPLMRMQIAANSDGTTVATLTMVRMKEYIIPLPPFPEQQRIVERLEEILSAISALKKDENKLEVIQQSFPKKMKDSLLQAAIQGNLTEQLPSDGNARDLLADIQAEKKRLIKAGKIKKEKPLPEITEDEIPFDIPDNWCWVRLGDIFQINPRNTVEDDVEASFIPMTMLDEGYISKFCYEKKLWKNIKSGFTHFSDDDIVFAKITPCFQNLKSAVMKKLVNGIGAGTTELHVLRRFTKAVDLFYTLYFLKNPIFIQDGLNTVQGTAGQQRIGKEYIKKYLFPLPPLAEQKRIVRRLEELLPKCDALNYDN